MVSARSVSKPATDPPVVGLTPESVADRRSALLAGHTGDTAIALALARHAEPSVRAAAIGALDIAGQLTPALIEEALGDPAWPVRRRASELAGRQVHSRQTAGDGLESLVRALVLRIGDVEPLVAEAAAWALGELIPESEFTGRTTIIESLGSMATAHKDPLCREAAVAALGSIGEPSSIDAVLQALDDKPPIRRRATVALAAFDDPRADEALRRCLEDRDWQVRQAAEDLLGRPGS